jgi:hypothetical protein
MRVGHFYQSVNGYSNGSGGSASSSDSISVWPSSCSTLLWAALADVRFAKRHVVSLVCRNLDLLSAKTHL